MDKKEFLAFSLPYGLKILRPDNSTIMEMVGVIGGSIVFHEESGDTFGDKTKCNIILHPLSDLTKDEWIEKLNTFACELLDAAHVYDEKNVIGLNWITQPFEIVMWLIEHHFDVAGLIEKGEAIDVNTLPENPYK